MLPAALGLACGKPPVEVERTREIPVASITYEGWNAVLRRHVSAGHVNYATLVNDPRFAAFLEEVRDARIDESTPRNVHLAFLINAYNAQVIAGVLAGRTPETLWSRNEFFRRARYVVAGEEITLHDLEDERIRPLGEARVHFAIVGASVSCPPLASEAYWPDRLDAQLERAARRFVNDPRRNRFDMQRQAAELSPIFDWYQEDFVRDAGSMQRFVARFLDDPDRARLLKENRLQIQFALYDWRLNGTPPPPPPEE